MGTSKLHVFVDYIDIHSVVIDIMFKLFCRKVVRGMHQSEASLILLDNNDTPTGHSPYNVYYSHAFVLRWTWIVLLVQFTGYNDWILNPRLNATHKLNIRNIHWNLPSWPLLFYPRSESTVWIWFLS